MFSQIPSGICRDGNAYLGSCLGRHLPGGAVMCGQGVVRMIMTVLACEKKGRRGRRASALLFTLMAAAVLMILSCAYLSYMECDNRFSGYQERSERAWWLAQSGFEYYCSYGCGSTPLSTSSKVIDPPRVLVRVYVPAGNTRRYFELADMGQGRLLSRGVETGTLSSSGKEVTITRSLYVDPQNLEDAYDISLSF